MLALCGSTESMNSLCAGYESNGNLHTSVNFAAWTVERFCQSLRMSHRRILVWAQVLPFICGISFDVSMSTTEKSFAASGQF